MGKQLTNEQKVLNILKNSKTIKFVTRGVAINLEDGFRLDIATRSPRKYSSSYKLTNFENALGSLCIKISKAINMNCDMCGSSISGISFDFS
jgi:hypothetical protein